MKNRHLKNALLGICLALVAAYLYVAVVGVFIAGARGLSILFSSIPFVLLFYTSWVVIPLGAALGMLIPQIAAGKTRWMAALQGAALGAVAGLLSVVCLASANGIPVLEATFIVLTMIAYCAIWVGAYAFYRAKGQSLYR